MTGPRQVFRLRRTGALAVLAALALVLLGAQPASAHATLESTSPAQGSEVAVRPTAVVLTFSEAVGITPTSITVVDTRGRSVSNGAVTHPGGDARLAGVPLVPDLPRGSYLVVWHVVSDDSHPASGVFSFGYAVPAADPSEPLPGDPLLTLLHGLAGFGALAGTIVLLGATFFFTVLWRRGPAVSRSRRLVVLAWVVAAVSTAALIVLEGPYGASRPLADVADGSLIRLTLGTLYGKLLLLRLVALGASAAVWWGARRRGRAPGAVDVGGLAFLVIESFSFGGHAGQGSWVPLAATMDAVHLAAASVWLGGLAVLGSVLLAPPRDAGPPADLDAVLPRWSRAARWAVVALVITGTYQAWRQTGGWAPLATTSYGRLVLAKVAVLTLMLALAAYGRRWIVRHVPPLAGAGREDTAAEWFRRARAVGGSAPAGDVPHAAAAPGALLVREPAASPRPPRTVVALRRSVAAEAALGAVVLALTAALVTSVPARQAWVPTFTTSLVARSRAGETLRVEVVVRPTRAGDEGLSVQASTPAGRRVPLQDAVVSFTNPALGIGPIRLDLATRGSGRVQDALISVPAPGRWQLTMQLQAGSATYSATTGYTVG